MNNQTLVLIVLVIVVLAGLPTWPYSAGWGYYPSGGLGLLLCHSPSLVPAVNNPMV